MGGYWVYILASRKRGTLYIGMTGDLGRRMTEHRDGLAEGFTRHYAVTRLVHAEHFDALDDARRREHQLKGWRRQWKIELVETDNPEWEDLFGIINR